MSNPTTPPSDSLGADRRAGLFDPIPELIGPYRIVELLGTGGMGEVYKAEQREPIRRTVALKIIKLGFDSREVVARFESERQALSRMDHPHVARVLDAGVGSNGRPYFVMEYVPGKPITHFADDNALSINDRLELFIQACDAIAHAHTKAVIHRDIKSANVLAFTLDGKPTVKVIDFGIAKALTGDRLSNLTYNTSSGQIVGTIDSMSPEQADGSPDIDTRTDVYSLGVLLYELLIGVRPFDYDMLAHSAEHEMKRVIREVEPPRPSTRFGNLGSKCQKFAQRRQTKRDALIKQLRRELEWIPLMAMRKERARRYASVAELRDDVRDYLQGLPLRAAPESNWYRIRKFAARNALATTAVLALIAMTIVGVGSYIHTMSVERKLMFQASVEKSIALLAADRDRDALLARQTDLARQGIRQRAVATLLQRIVGLNAAEAVDIRSASKERLLSLRKSFDDEAARLDKGLLAVSPDEEMALRSMLHSVFIALGDIPAAEQQLLAALRVAERGFGRQSADYAEAAAALGEFLQSENKLADAEAPLRDAMTIRWEHLGPRAAPTTQSASHLAALLDNTGRQSEASDLREKCGLSRP